MSLFTVAGLPRSAVFHFSLRPAASPLAKVRDKWIGRNPNAPLFRFNDGLSLTGYVTPCTEASDAFKRDTSSLSEEERTDDEFATKRCSLFSDFEEFA